MQADQSLSQTWKQEAGGSISSVDLAIQTPLASDQTHRLQGLTSAAKRPSAEPSDGKIESHEQPKIPRPPLKHVMVKIPSHSNLNIGTCIMWLKKVTPLMMYTKMITVLRLYYYTLG